MNALHRTQRVTLDITINAGTCEIESVELKDCKNIRNEFDQVINNIPANLEFARNEVIEECAKIVHDEINQVRYQNIERAEKRIRQLKTEVK